MLNALPTAKFAAQIVCALGVSKIVNDIVVNNVNVVTTADAVKVWAGSMVIASILVEQSSNHIERTFNSVVAWNEGRKTETVTA